MIKNKKRIKSIAAMLEAQNKLLRSLALTIDPSLELQEGTEEASWKTDGGDSRNGRNQSSLETIKELKEEPTDGTGVDSATEDKPLTDVLFESGL